MANLNIHPKADTEVKADVHSSIHGKVRFTITTEDGTVDLFVTPHQAQQLINTALLSLRETVGKHNWYPHRECGVDCTR